MCRLLLLLGLFLAACQSASEAGPARASSITCHTAYRLSVSVPIEREEAITIADEDSQQAIRFTDLSFHADYSDGASDNERALRLWVTEPGQTDPLISQLYQLPAARGPQNQFIGGHGFTGLNYVYHPTTGAELQYWCTADGDE